MSTTLDTETLIRAAMREWYLDTVSQYGYVIDAQVLATACIQLPDQAKHHKFIHTMKGITVPRDCTGAMAIYSSHKGPYNDEFLSTGTIRYSLAKVKPSNQAWRENQGLMHAMTHGLPIIFVQGINGKRVQYKLSLVVITRYIDDGVHGQVELQAFHDEAFDAVYRSQEQEEQEQELADSDWTLQDIDAASVKRWQSVRRHQQRFAKQVKAAYSNGCAVCTLKQKPLLEAAHILPFAKGGPPMVPNGMALCSIHHRAYDENIVGVTPDYTVEVNTDILALKNGPMLLHGLQEMHGRSLSVPQEQTAQPNRDYLDSRYQAFRTQ